MKNKPKVALITGASQGIGAEIAATFVEKGYFVCLVDYNEELGKLQEKKLAGRSKFYFCDLSESTHIEKLAHSLSSDFEAIDTIIHNARAPAKEKDIFLNLDLEWDRSFRVMLKHPILLTHHLLNSLKKSSNPSVLYIGSTNAHFISHQPLSYHVFKGALSQAVRYLACEYGPDKIRVNLLHPGIVDVVERSRKNPELFDEIVKSVIPLKRTALAKEVGECCLFFASESAKYINGTSIDLDGGEHLKDHFSLMMSQYLKQSTSNEVLK